jgi:hypothetical protein
MKVVVQRLQEHFGNQIEWVPLSTIASRFVAEERAKFEIAADEKSVRVSISSPFDADVITFTVTLPWRLEAPPNVMFGDTKLTAVENEAELRAGTFLSRGAAVTVSLPVSKGGLKILSIESV